MVEPSNKDGWNKIDQLPVGFWGSLSGLYRNRHEDGLNMGPCGSFSLKFTSSCLVSVCRALRKRAVLLLSDSKSREREKIGNIHVESLARYLRTPEFRIQFYRQTTSTHKQFIRTKKSNIHNSVLLKHFSKDHPHFQRLGLICL